MADRLAVHAVGMLGAPLSDYDAAWQDLGLTRLSLIDAQLEDPALGPLVARRGYVVDTVYHLFGGGSLPRTPRAAAAARAALNDVVDAAALLGARCVYMLTGGRGNMTWEQAAEAFAAAVAPCRERAADAGVALAIENASALYADLHIAHTLRDTAALADLAGLDVCIDLFHCWAEAGVTDLVETLLPRTQSVQLSDYVLGDRALPARAVPGDGVIPIEPLVATVLAGGYRHGFDLELIGPRIDAEGTLLAARRARDAVAARLERAGEDGR